MTRNLWRRWFSRRPSRQGTSGRRTAQPSLEVLEDRTVPAVFTVGAGDVATLITDINKANSNGDPSNVINLTQSTYDLMAVDNFWYGPNALPPISSNLTIHGNGATIQRDPAGHTPFFRLFYVSGGLELPAGSLTMDNLTLQNGEAEGGNSDNGGGGLGAGGAIFNQGTLNLTDVTLTQNIAAGGFSGVTTAGNGGGGMGQVAPSTGAGGGFGGSVGAVVGTGGAGGIGGGGGGGGFITGANGTAGSNVAGSQAPGVGGGQGGFGGGSTNGTGDGGEGGVGSGLSADRSGAGGAFGSGGDTGSGLSGGGGGGVGGGGASGTDGGGSGGFGGGGGASDSAAGVVGGAGGFGGGGAGTSTSITGGTPGAGGAGGFGGGAGTSGGVGGGGAGMGGAIFNMGADDSGGQATLVNCTLTQNFADGAINRGQATSEGLGGAIFNLDGSVTLTNDTLDLNQADDGGTVYNLAFGNDIRTGGPVTAALVLNNSILADSHVFSQSADLVNNVVNGAGTNTATVTGSHNLVATSQGTIGAGVITLTTSPNLVDSLQNNGGLTPTLLPQTGSPVLGAGDPSLAPSTDQRGLLRPANGPTDLGSVQVSGVPTSPPPGSPPPGSPPPPPSSPPPPPPSLFQAVIALYLDGVELEVTNQGNSAGFHGDLNLAAELGRVLAFFGNPSLDQIDASIAFNEPFAGPFGPLVVQAGQRAVDNAIQQ